MKQRDILLMAMLLLPASVIAQNVKDEDAMATMAAKSYSAYIEALLKTDFDKDGTKYSGFRSEVGSDGYRYYWEQDLTIMGLEDVAEYMLDPQAITIVDDVLQGFLVHENGDFGNTWNEYMDDMGWNGTAFIRGYRITGRKEYLEGAKKLFAENWTRGQHGPGDMWDTSVQDGSAGLWWRVKPDVHAEVGTWSNVYKSPLAVSPTINIGMYIYELTGDSSYIPKCENLWRWETDVLWIEGEGIAEGWHPTYHGYYNGTWQDQEEYIQSRRTTHDLGSFFEATINLWRLTGKEIYWTWIEKILDNIFTKRLSSSYVIQNAFSARDGAWCWEIARPLTMLARYANLWDETKTNRSLLHLPSGYTYYQWMCNSAKEISSDNTHVTVLPTRKPGYNIEAEDAVWENAELTTRPIQAVARFPKCPEQIVTNLGKGNQAHFVIDAAKAGTYTVSLCYNTTTRRRVQFLVNGVDAGAKILGPYTKSCYFTGSNATIPRNVVQMDVPLRAGYNIITYTATTVAPDVDFLCYYPAATNSGKQTAELSDSLVVEAEYAARLYGTRRNGTPECLASSKYSGYGAISNIGAGNYATYSINASEAGQYWLTLTYLPGEEDKSIFVTTNSTAKSELQCPATDGVTATTAALPITLKAGSNTIRLDNANAGVPAVDYFTITRDDPTAIHTASASGSGTDGLLYNLSGQRVSERQTGLVIKNGKARMRN